MCNQECNHEPDKTECSQCELTSRQRLWDQFFRASEELEDAYKSYNGKLTNPYVVAASERLAKVCLELQKMGVAIDA